MGIERPIAHESPAVSVVVPSTPTNDHEEVVASLQRQTYDQFEVIVVNDSELSVCEARNVGLENAVGDITAFTDDDCRPSSTWVETFVGAFENIEDLVIVEGPVRGGLEYDGTRKYPTCNIAADRETALDVGGFDERFEYWREDTEFGWRMEELGAYRFCEEMEMIHPDRPRSILKQDNEALLQKTHPEKYEEIIVPDAMLQKLNHFLWQRGFWDFINEFRYSR